MHNDRAMSDPNAILEHMFDDGTGGRGTEGRSTGTPAAVVAPQLDSPAALDVAGLHARVAELAHLGRTIEDAERIDRLRALEELKSAAAAAQARITADLHASVSTAHAAAGLPVAERGRGVATQVALARRDSPNRGGRHLGLARALVHEMPHTLAALAAGRLSEWRATVLVRETACLSRHDRAAVDAALCADPATLDGAGDGTVIAKARAMAARLDPQSVTARARKAETERRVTLRPAPDTMANLSALLPVADGVAAYAALMRAAEAARAAGDPRGRGQVMADTLVDRLTGCVRAPADPHGASTDNPGAPDIRTGADLMVNLVITDRTLFAGDPEPANITGYGPVPAPLARDLVRGDHHHRGDTAGTARVFLRRQFTHPSTSELIAMEARARAFPLGLRRLLIARDQTCRTPWCDAPVRHADHAVAHADGGRTDSDNGQGLCEACNYAKESPGHRARAGPDNRPGHHEIHTIMPTGHTYVGRPPAQPGWTGRALAEAGVRDTATAPSSSHLELFFADYLHRAA